MALKINEIFHSIQGESSYAGVPCVFVRLTGCNLRCSYCDTEYAYEQGQFMEIKEILEKVSAFDCDLVEITGGEPLLQSETPYLIAEMLDENFTVLLETNGSKDINIIDDRCVRIVDVKCPSSGESGNNNLLNLSYLTHNDELKFVIGDREDYDFSKKILELIPKGQINKRKVLFSSVFGKLEPRKLAEWMLGDRLDVRMQLQLHKYIWDAELRGV